MFFRRKHKRKEKNMREIPEGNGTFFFSFIIVIMGTEGRTQELLVAKQVIYYSSHTLALFSLFFFFSGTGV
jgi:hypothetical protein